MHLVVKWLNLFLCDVMKNVISLMVELVSVNRLKCALYVVKERSELYKNLLLEKYMYNCLNNENFYSNFINPYWYLLNYRSHIF